MSLSLIRAFGLLSCLGLSACMASDPNDSSSAAQASSEPGVSSSSVMASSSSAAAVNSPPQVVFATPIDGYTFNQAAANIGISADASDPDGNLASVSFRVNGALVGVKDAAPFQWSAGVLSALPAGQHMLELEARDSDGLTATASISVTALASVNRPPEVTFTYPKEGDVLPNNTSLDITVDATDPDGDTLSVQMYLNSQLLAADNQAPYRWPASVLPQLQNLPTGSYILRAFVEDGRGESNVAEISFNVLEDNDFPTLTLISPPEGLILPIGSSIDVLAEASDTDGTIQSVSLSFNGTEQEDSVAPYQWLSVANNALQDLAAGEYQVTLSALDDKGGKTTVTRTVIVSADAEAGAGDPLRGKTQFFGLCMRCHGQFGEGAGAAPALLPVREQYSGLPLHQYISERMPKDYTEGCTGQCGRNVATFMREQLSALRDDYANLNGDAVAGEIAFAEQCVSCHGDRGLGGSAKALFPLRVGNEYTIANADINTSGNLFAMVDLAMPRGTGPGRLNQYVACQGQCAADVVAYLQQAEAGLSDAEQLELRLARAKQQYESGCGTPNCHGSDGRGRRPIVPLSDSERNNDSLDNNDGFFVYIRDRMPLGDPTGCDAECSANVALYIREVLD